ncbi:MAG TPA: RNA polymerase sigma-70 factor [Niabella sp.]|nr:RNA polymerase sigma-70 factor [Niabella sp.]
MQKKYLNEKLPEGWKKQIAAGDHKVFRQFFDLFADRLTNFAFSITQNRTASIQIMDEVFVQIWKNRTSLTEIDNITTYLYKAIKNTALNYLSKKAKEKIFDAFDNINIDISFYENPEQNLISSEILKRINDAVDALPPKCKMIFKLVREDGLKYRQVAEILNISVNTVDAQMVIAVKKISEKVKIHLDTLPLKSSLKK